MRDAVLDLERHGQLVRISAEVDPYLEMAEIQRRAYRAQAPALLFERVKGSPFPAVSNLFGTLERARFLFRHTFTRVQKAIELRADPTVVLRRPWRYLDAPFTGLASLPMRAWRAPVLAHRTTLSQLPGVVSWPDDGGPFVTLPQVYSEDPDDPRPLRSNVGMYRIQLAGNAYRPDQECGLHYQIHRGIGIHHAAAVRRGEKLRVSVFVGGPPAHTVAAVMPLPEGLSELVFAGMLAGRRFRHTTWSGHRIAADADFAIVGTIDPSRTLPEGPFGDHLGYYAKVHDFPVLEVEAVFHREGAIWPFTVVGRPPQEDTTFGALIHELTGPMVPVSLPGVHALHAVDAAGVHPLLLAIGSERYVPYRREAPQELLTIANAILGFSQASLAKVLMIAAKDDVPELDIHDVGAFLEHVLSRFDPRRDLHFQTKTTMDTLDYSGTGLNAGSKLVIAALGPARRTLAREVPGDLKLPDGFGDPRLARPGVVAVRGPQWSTPDGAVPSVHGTHPDLRRFAEGLDASAPALREIAAIVVCDDPDFVARSLENFLWATFTRMNPSHDLDGVGAFVEHKHWGCEGPLVLDARRKDHHAPPLIEDPEVTRRVDALAAKGGPLHGLVE
jgi:4-hydroxy-3-polyprenylbenzoate decarboxylase